MRKDDKKPMQCVMRAEKLQKDIYVYCHIHKT